MELLNKITCGDSYKLIKEIPDKSVDLIITDPPYLIETEGGDTEISRSFSNCASEISVIGGGIDLAILDEFMRVMKKPNIYIWCNKKQIIDYLDFFVKKHGCNFEILVWCKTNPTPLCGGNYLIDKEFCLYFRKGVKLNTAFETARTFWVTKKNVSDKQDFLHMTIKPMEIIRTLIKNSSNENDIVADFFVGSGTTCVAAKELGRQYIGIEIEPKWAKIAEDRLQGIDAHGQIGMFLR